jgi:hypothetical protein
VSAASAPLRIVVRCAETVARKARYVFDTLFMAAGLDVEFVDAPPADGPWLLYAPRAEGMAGASRCLHLAHEEAAWQLFESGNDADRAVECQGVPVVLAQGNERVADSIAFDLPANAFFFLSSWSERTATGAQGSRRLHAHSVFARLGVPQDIVDRYLDLLLSRLRGLYARLCLPPWPAPTWPQGARFAVVLSHDIDFLPAGFGDIALQGAKTFMRHLVRQRDPADALRALAGLARAAVHRRDPYGCVPQMLKQEQRMGVRASYQVAVGRRHPADVNYRIEDDRVRDYLRAIVDIGFEVCLHGSYRSTENDTWYAEEVALLSRRLARPLGSRQHFLSFNADRLFSMQERCGIEYDMSMGYPDRPGARSGFSHPYFPYCFAEDRPYRVLQLSLVLMDVTLRGYMNLRPDAAWPLIERELQRLAQQRGAASVVWHPIVFGGARDPGYDRLFWRLVERVQALQGWATDGRGVNAAWRQRAARYASFAPHVHGAPMQPSIAKATS